MTCQILLSVYNLGRKNHATSACIFKAGIACTEVLEQKWNEAVVGLGQAGDGLGSKSGWMRTGMSISEVRKQQQNIVLGAFLQNVICAHLRFF